MSLFNMIRSLNTFMVEGCLRYIQNDLIHVGSGDNIVGKNGRTSVEERYVTMAITFRQQARFKSSSIDVCVPFSNHRFDYGPYIFCYRGIGMLRNMFRAVLPESFFIG